MMAFALVIIVGGLIAEASEALGVAFIFFFLLCAMANPILTAALMFLLLPFAYILYDVSRSRKAKRAPSKPGGRLMRRSLEEALMEVRKHLSEEEEV